MRLIHSLSEIFAKISGWVMLALAGLIAISVVMRYVFGTGFLFVEEVAGYMMMLIVFFSLAHAAAQKEHIFVDFLVRKYKNRYFSTLPQIFNMLFSTVILIGSVNLFLSFVKRGRTAPTILETPLFIPSLFIVIGSLLFFLMTFTLMVRSFTEEKGDV